MWKLVNESAQKDKQNILFLLTTILGIRTMQVGKVPCDWSIIKKFHKNLNIHWSSLTAPRLFWYLWELDDWLRMLIDAMSALMKRGWKRGWQDEETKVICNQRTCEFDWFSFWSGSRKQQKETGVRQAIFFVQTSSSVQKAVERNWC